MLLFHGSSVSISEPLASVGRRNLDFGKGFYTTRLKEQAQKWAVLVSSRRSEDNKGKVSIFEFDENAFSDNRFVYKDFPVYDIEWLEFVISCRQGRDTTNYDIVEGGVANDQVIDTVEDYENGRITADQALDQLKFKTPHNQLCIRNQQVIDEFLRFKGFEEVVTRELI